MLSATLAHAQATNNSVYTEELTWFEIQQRIKSGATTLIIPTGSTQQSGPHLETGMHNVVARYAAGEIARRLRNALVAPVVPFAPAGRIDPPEGHMQFQGTYSLSEYTYQEVLEDIARSAKQHGFRMICFLGDGAGSQAVMDRTATQLAREWHTQGIQVIYLSDYYEKAPLEEWTDRLGVPATNPTAHAGHVDTSEMMAIDASGVRDTMRASHTERDYRVTGSMGDSTLASADYGRKYLGLKIEAAIKQIQNASSRSE